VKVGDLVRHTNGRPYWPKTMVGMVVSSGGHDLGILWFQVLWPDGDYPELHNPHELEVVSD
jgi:hypothetical protein